MKKILLISAFLFTILGFSQFNLSAPWIDEIDENRNNNEKTLEELVIGHLSDPFKMPLHNLLKQEEG